MKKHVRKSLSLLLSIMMLAACIVPGSFAAAAQTGNVTFFDDFSDYAPGELTATNAKEGYVSINGCEVVDLGVNQNALKMVSNGASDAASLSLASSDPEKTLQFDFLYDVDYTSFYGIYVNFFTDAARGETYSMCIIPAYANHPTVQLQCNNTLLTGGGGTAGTSPNNWYTCKLEYKGGVYGVKLWAAGQTEPEAWTAQANLASRMLTGSADDRIDITNLPQEGVLNLYLDNLSIIEYVPEPAQAAEYAFADDYESYSPGTITTETAKEGYTSLQRCEIAEIGTGNKALKLVSLAEGDQRGGFGLTSTTLDKELRFDFLFDKDYSQYFGLYTNLFGDVAQELSYNFAILPAYSQQVLLQGTNMNNVGGGASLKKNTWYSCAAQMKDGIFSLKLWPKDRTEPEAWLVQADLSSKNLAYTGESEIFFSNAAVENDINLYVDNLTVAVWEEEPEEPEEPETADFFDDFDAYDKGEFTLANAKPAYQEIVSGTITAPGSGSNVLQLTSVGNADSSVALKAAGGERTVQFDFLYDTDYTSVYGVYLTVFKDTAADREYSVNILPAYTQKIILQCYDSNGHNSQLGSGSWNPAANSWFTCKAQVKDGIFAVKIWSRGETEPEAWSASADVSSYAPTTSEGDRISITNIGRSGTVNLQIDNLSVQYAPEEPEEPEEPETADFFDDFDAYDRGEFTLANAKPAYQEIVSGTITAPGSGSNVLQLTSVGNADSSVALKAAGGERTVQFDFLYDTAYTEYFGVYLTVFKDTVANREYSVNILPAYTQKIILQCYDPNSNQIGSGTWSPAVNSWFTCKAQVKDGIFAVKIWPVGTDEPAAWNASADVSSYAPTTSEGDRISIANIGRSGTVNLQIDNLSVQYATEEPETADFFDDFGDYDKGEFALADAKPAYEEIVSAAITALGSGSNVLKLSSTADTTAKIALKPEQKERTIRFDFLYEGTYPAGYGLYLTVYNSNTPAAAAYLAAVVPTNSQKLLLQAYDPDYRSLGSGSWSPSESSWFTCKAEMNGDTFRVKIWPIGTDEPAAWNASSDFSNVTLAASEADRIELQNIAGTNADLYIDNLSVTYGSAFNEPPTEPEDLEPQYTWMEETFEGYEIGDFTKEAAPAKYSSLKDISIMESDETQNKALYADASGSQPLFNVSCNLIDKQVEFDFRYDDDFVSYGGFYVTMHRQPNNGGDYYFSITPYYTSDLIVSVGTKNLSGVKLNNLTKDTWLTCKARLYQDYFWIKIWQKGTAEPTSWNFKYDISGEGFVANPADSVGIMFHDNNGHTTPVWVDNYTIKTWEPIDLEEYTLTLNVNDETMGTVIGAGEYLDCATVEVKAEPKHGFRFLRWEKDGAEVSTRATYKFVLEGDTTLTAVFEPASLVLRSFMAVGMTEEAVISESDKTVSVRLASDTDLANVPVYFYTDADVACEREDPYESFDFSNGPVAINNWTVTAVKNDVMRTIYVNGTLGNDSNTGASPSGAFRTIERAKEEVASISEWTGDVVVSIAAGEYVLDKTLTFTEEDGAAKGYAVIYKGESAESTVLSGAMTLTGWSASQTVPGAWEINAPVLPDGIEYSRDLFVDGERATLARGSEISTSGGWSMADNPDLTITGSGYTATGLLANMYTFRNPGDIECVYEVGWTYVIVPVESITQNGSGSTIKVNQDAYDIAHNKGGLSVADPNYFQNVFEYLDEEGEWYFDRAAQKIYYIPAAGVNPNDLDIRMPVLDTLVEVNGKDGDPVYGFALKNLSFRYTSYYQCHTDGHGEIQANLVGHMDNLAAEINNFNKIPSGVEVRYAEGVRVENCTLSCMSANGLDYDVGVVAGVIYNNRIQSIGGTGVAVGGANARDGQPTSATGWVNGELRYDLKPEPGRATHDVLVLSNLVSNIGIQFKGAIGIFVGYTSDVTVSFNEVAHTSYSGISAGWGWGCMDYGCGRSPINWEGPSVMERYVIENNNIHDIMERLYDGAGIYTLSDMPGSFIRGNVIRNSSHIGIYNDECSGGIEEMSENIILNAPQWYFYHYMNTADTALKRDNIAAGMHDNFTSDMSGDALYDLIIARANTRSEIPALPPLNVPDAQKKNLFVCSVSVDDGELIYNGADQRPEVMVEFGDYKLILGEDYTVSYPEMSVSAGVYEFTVYGEGLFTGSVHKSYEISPLQMEDVTVVLAAESLPFNGAVQHPEVTASIGDFTLTEGTDYTLQYSSGCKNAGSDWVTVTGIGSVKGSEKKTFEITKQLLSDVNFTLLTSRFDWDGNAKTPLYTVKNEQGRALTSGADFDVVLPEGRTDPGSYTITVTGKANYTGTASATFTIIKQIRYTVAFDPNGGSGTMSELELTGGVSKNLRANVFTRDGYRFTGWATDPRGAGDLYTDKAAVVNLTDEDGARVTMYAQWQKIGWVKEDGQWFWLDAATGEKQTGWKQVDGKWYYLGADGVMQSGWARVNGAWYYLGLDGAMRTGWQTVNGNKYYLSTNGIMQVGWKQINGNWYYFGTNGIMQVGWKQINGSWYYLGTDGVMQVDWRQINGKWYYLGTDGAMRTGWQNLNGRWYYLDTNGAMVTGWKQLNGKWYYFTTDGVMRIGWQTVDGKKYYLDTNGAMVTGWKKADGAWYFFDANGAMKTGWYQENGNRYYLKANGAMACGETLKIGTKNYTFSETGACVNP